LLKEGSGKLKETENLVFSLRFKILL